MHKETKPEDTYSLGIHVTLATISQNQEKEFDKYLSEKFYKTYREKHQDYCTDKEQNESHYFSQIDRETPRTNVLYNPLKFHMFGNYDTVYISLIDNFKFLHKIIEPTSDQIKVFNAHNYQSFACISNKKINVLKNFFFKQISNLHSKYFVGICNLKLNNGLIIGNGIDYVKTAIEKIEKLINEEFNNERSEKDKIRFLVSQTFSWFELTLLIFTNNPKDIPLIVGRIRDIQIKDLINKDNIINNSLYKSLDFKNDQILNTSLLSDTQTFVGVNSNLIYCQEDASFLKEFKNSITQINKMQEEVGLYTEIECQVKPGHISSLIKAIEDNEILKEIFKNDQSKNLISGKSDYILYGKEDSILNNVVLLREIYHNKIDLFSHVRNIKTRIKFRTPVETKNARNEVISLSEKLKELAIEQDDIKKIDSNLKALKVSRQIRFKILKIFYNFNNGIQDVIMFSLFLDFKVFIENLKELIFQEFKDWEQISSNIGNNPYINNVNSFEEKLFKWIEIFQEGYNIRLLNGYQFEDIIDFDLDFNTSIQQLLSSLSTFSHSLGKLFYPNGKFGPIIQLNYKDTVANYLSINYSSHHITSPEFMFSTISKEFINYYDNDIIELKLFRSNYTKKISKRKFRIENRLLYNMIDNGLIKIDYFINDSIRFYITYDHDFELFQYWFWAYNMQNPALFNKSGMLNEEFFRKELFRIMFVAKFYNIDFKELKCDIPSLQTYWSRHFESTKKALINYFEILSEIKLKEKRSNLLEDLSDTIYSILLGLFKNMNLQDEKIDEERYLNNLQKFKYLGKVNTIDAYPFYELFHRRSYLYNQFKEGKRPGNENTGIYLHWYIFDYLNKIMNKNKKTVLPLNRDWKTGKPMLFFLKHADKKPMYYIDQTGGVFFDQLSQMREYFKLSSETINFIIDTALKSKKQFIMDFINSKEIKK